MKGFIIFMLVFIYVISAAVYFEKERQKDIIGWLGQTTKQGFILGAMYGVESGIKQDFMGCEDTQCIGEKLQVKAATEYPEFFDFSK